MINTLLTAARMGQCRLGTLAALHALSMLGLTHSLAGDFYVRPDGSDHAAGNSPSVAFRTIQHAADVAQAGDTVYIFSGIYRESVRPANSGTPDAPIVFVAADGADVLIDGTEIIDGWKAAAPRQFVADMPGDFFQSRFNQSDQVFIDQKMVPQARWPNTGNDASRPAKSTLTRFISKHTDPETRWTTVVFEDDKLPSDMTRLSPGAEIYVQPNAAGWGWTLSGEVLKVENKRLIMRSRSANGQDGKGEQYAVGARYYIYNDPALLDAPGEWYHDRKAGKLVLRTDDGKTPAKGSVRAKQRDWAFDLSERSYITIRNISLFACTITTDAGQAGDGVWFDAAGKDRYLWRPAGFVAPSRGITIDGVNAKYLNHYTDVSGHFFYTWPSCTGIVLAGQDHVIQNCRIQFSAGNGINLQGNRHKCLNNVILDTNYMSTDAAAITTGTSARTYDCEIAHNTVNRTGRSGVTLRVLANSDPKKQITRVHHNDIANYGLQDWDVGAFYMFGSDGQFARIDHNLFHCDEPREGWVNGIYFDFSKNFLIDHNVVWGVPVPLQLTHEFDHDGAQINNMLIYHNTLITNDSLWSKALYADTNRGSILQNNLIKLATFKDPNGKLVMRWPNWGRSEPTLVTNMHWGRTPDAQWVESQPGPSDIVADDPGFVNATAHDFRLAPASPAIGRGTAITAQTRDGITVDCPSDAPFGQPIDIGARQSGTAEWTAGSSLATDADRTPKAAR